MTTAMTKNSPTINPIQTMNNGITQDQANMMLMRLTALRGVLANGGNVHECQAALIAVTDELKHLLTAARTDAGNGQSGAVQVGG